MACRVIICYLFIFGSLPYASSQINGFVYDRQTSQPIADCHVVLSGQTERQTVTDEQGFFVFTSKTDKNNFSIRISHINYVPKEIQVAGTDTLQIYLETLSRKIDEVVIHSSYRSTNRGNEYTYSPMEALSTISIVGEPDVIRHISSMPGVSQGMEGTLGLFVRGGNNGSNSVIFNGVPVYSSTHVGMFSAFSPEIVSESSFYLGGTPSEYGNFSSSLITIDTKKHYGEPFQGKITLSPYLTGGYVSLPLKKERLSVQVSGRTSFLPFLLNLFAKPHEGDHEQLKAQLLDFTALADCKVNENNRLDMMFHTTNDYLDYRFDDSQNRLNWGSNAFKLGWDSRLSQKLKAGVFVYYVTSFSRQEQKYFVNSNTDQLRSILRLGSGIDEFSAGINLLHRTTDRLNIKVGVQYQSKRYEPLSEKSMVSDDVSTDYENKFGSQTGNLSSAFMEIKYILPQAISASLGYRNSIWSIADKNNWDFDLHFLADIYLTERWGIEMTYDRFVQYFHVLEGLPLGWSHNVVAPADERFPNEITNQVFTGVYWKYQSEFSINATAGIFYRKMGNLVSYVNPSNLFGFSDVSWYNEVDIGTGESFGFELSASLQGKRTGTTLAYTLSKSDRKFQNINEGSKFPFKFDRRHILNLQSKYTTVSGKTKKGKKREQYVNAVLSWSSGNRATLPTGSNQGVTPPFWEQREPGWNVPIEMDDNAYHRQMMSGKNEIKMKDYFRIDLAYTFVRYGKKANNEFAVSVFNILNRKNPYLYYHENKDWYQLSIFPVMPTLRWSISF